MIDAVANLAAAGTRELAEAVVTSTSAPSTASTTCSAATVGAGGFLRKFFTGRSSST